MEEFYKQLFENLFKMRKRILILCFIALLAMSTQALSQSDDWVWEDEEEVDLFASEVSFPEKLFTLFRSDPEVKKLWVRSIPFSLLVIVMVLVLESLFVHPKKDSVATFYSKELIPSRSKKNGHEVEGLHEGKKQLPQGWYFLFVPQFVVIVWMFYRITLSDFIRNANNEIIVNISPDALNAKEASIFMFFICLVLAFFLSKMHESKDSPDA